MAEIIPLRPNSRTAERKRLERQQTQQRIIKRIGINHEDAPLYSEELKFLAYEEQLKQKPHGAGG